MLLHLFIMSYQNSPPWSMNSLIVSEGLLVWILSTLVRDGQQNKSMYNNSNNLGMIGRGYVVLALVVWITDSMTLGGWLVSHALWDMDGRVWMIMTARGILWCASIVSTCHLLTVLHEIPTCGSWKSVVWWVVEPCCSSTSRSVDMMKWSNNGVHLGSKPHSPTSTNVIETSHLV